MGLIHRSVLVAIGNRVTDWQDIGAELGGTNPSDRVNLLKKPAVAFKWTPPRNELRPLETKARTKIGGRTELNCDATDIGIAET